jgi:hypothetical protein
MHSADQQFNPIFVPITKPDNPVDQPEHDYTGHAADTAVHPPEHDYTGHAANTSDDDSAE